MNQQDKMYAIGDKLCTLREQQGLSQEQLAEKLQVTRQTVSNWENGKVKMDAVSATEICRALQVSLEELLCEQDAAEAAATMGRHPKNTKVLWIVFAVALALAVLALVFAVAFGSDAASSTLVISSRSGWIIFSCACAVCVGVAATLLWRTKK